MRFMLSQRNFTEEHIRELQRKSKRDPALIERTIFAFGLLEALTRVGMPFVFKGGTCMMLLLDQLRRLSTDIDIIVEPGTSLDDYFEQASAIFPFIRYEEQKRIGANNIEKRHIKFTYNSPINKNEFYILLDVLYEENPYPNVVERDIQNDLLITEPDYIKVKVPSPDCILGDKLTAFAPHTIGIPINSNKDLEVMKQLYDVCSLLDVFSDYNMVSATYNRVAPIEIAYRNADITPRDALEDTFWAAACIASRGKIREDDYPFYIRGIRDLRNHVFVENYTAEVAAVRATHVMYIVACLLSGKEYVRCGDTNEYIETVLTHDSLAPLRYLKKIDPMSYSYAVKADQLL